ncbi:hypothetical protein CGRA01v4_04020 [Colletotrichum graminicola]|nr:hypothetical protein CGRA01v4_04020 [Colletotrichum graminicola]
MFVSPPSRPNDVQQLARQRRQARGKQEVQKRRNLMPGTIHPQGGGLAESLTFPNRLFISHRLVLSE